ncbi:MAG: prealbumin-like fold domain-containing protein, partial [Bacilli bacterium]|nr:prealbumin-like fold domain-containing protein [Bacilli bacterium]
MNQNKIRLLLAILVVFTIMIISKYYLHVSATNEEIITKGMIFNNDSDYVYSDYVYSYEEYQKMYEEYGKAIKSEHDQAPDDTHIYFAGMDILSKHAIWTSKVPQRLLKATTTSITIKNGGTWQANGYYGVIMKDDDGKYYYCASHGLDVPVGKYSYNESQSDKIMKALSWAYPNVNTNASQSVDYGKSQMAVWTALGQFNISKTTIGSTYYKIVDAYKGNIATNNKTFSINKGTNSEIIQDINMSTYLHFSGTAGWHISQSQLDYAKAHNFAYYVYQVSSKKYVKLTWTSFSSPANYSYLRIGTTDMNTNLNISNINIITQQAQRVGFLYNSSNNAYQNLWNTIEQEPQTIYTANLSITNKTGSVSLVKKANGIDLYEQSIIDSNNNLYYASKDGKQVIYEDGVNIAQILKYPNKQEMTSNNLFNKPITYQYIDYDNVMVDDITKAIVDEKGNEPTINDGTGNMITNLAWTPTYEKKQAIDENGIPIVKAKLAENNEPIMATRTLPLNYPSQTQMDNIYNLKGVEFTLTGTVNGKAVKQVKTTDANGQITWTGLLPATYTITETKTNENFILISNKYSAKVTTGNTTKV